MTIPRSATSGCQTGTDLTVPAASATAFGQLAVVRRVVPAEAVPAVLALLLVFLGTSQSSTGLLHAGGWAVFAFVIIGAYLFVDAMNAATGGKPLPLGRPVLG